MQSKPQLFCFTYAGGNKEFFSDIEKDLDRISVCALEYAGHGERYRESFYTDFDELADDIFREVKDRVIGEYALFGYSMGSITLLEVLKRIIATNLPMPTNVFLAAHEPRTNFEIVGFTENEFDNWVKDRTIRFGGVPDKLLNNNTFWRMYLPLFRADYMIIEKYEFEKLKLLSGIPATIFYSEKDTPYKNMKLWKKYFNGSCEYYQFEGTHFFIQQHHEEMAKIIREKMESNHGV